MSLSGERVFGQKIQKSGQINLVKRYSLIMMLKERDIVMLLEIGYSLHQQLNKE